MTRTFVVVLACAASRVDAQATPMTRRFERSVIPGAAGANRLPVDATLLAGAAPFEVTSAAGAQLAGQGTGSSGMVARGGLGDLRLYDRNEREVPYLLVWPWEEQPSWVGGRLLGVSPGKDTSGFELDLGAVTTVDRLDVHQLPDRFLKRVRLEGSGDRVHWTLLVNEGTLFNLPDESNAGMAMVQTQLAFAPGAFRYLRVIWDDHAGARLPLPSGARARVAPRSSTASDTLRAALTFQSRPSARRTSRYHLRLPATRLPIVALDLDVGGGNVLRRATVTEPQLGAGRLGPVQLGAAQLRRVAMGNVVASSLRVPIAAPTGAELDLVVDNGDNPPLEVRGIAAVFAPLPYIYFETATTDRLHARYGLSRREQVPPPQYDIEALRDTVKRIAAATASWGAANTNAVAEAIGGAPAALQPSPGSPVDVARFPYSRPIPTGSGLTALRIDAAALAHSSIHDIRIVDAQGRQVPYLLEVLDEPLEVDLAEPAAASAPRSAGRLPSPDDAAHSWYRIGLPYSGLPDATLRLETNMRVFTRNVGIVTRQPPRDPREEASTRLVASAAWSHDDPEAPAPPLEIDLAGRLPSDSLFIAIDDGDNQKLPITQPALLLPSYRLRFFREPSSALTMVYGRADVQAPRYDIALIAPRLLEAPAEDAVAGPERVTADEPAHVPMLVFWGVLGLAVLVLLLLIGRLVRAGPEAAGEATRA